jgi:hypothetical protein
MWHGCTTLVHATAIGKDDLGLAPSRCGVLSSGPCRWGAGAYFDISSPKPKQSEKSCGLEKNIKKTPSCREGCVLLYSVTGGGTPCFFWVLRAFWAISGRNFGYYEILWGFSGVVLGVFEYLWAFEGVCCWTCWRRNPSRTINKTTARDATVVERKRLSLDGTTLVCTPHQWHYQ